MSNMTVRGVALSHTTAGASEAARALSCRMMQAQLEPVLDTATGTRAHGELFLLATENNLLSSEVGIQATSTAAAFLAALPPSAQLPELSLDPDGEFCFDWSEGDDMLSVSLGASSRLTCAWQVSNSADSCTERFVGVLPSRLQGVLEAFKAR